MAKQLRRELDKRAEELDGCLEVVAAAQAALYREQNASVELDFSGVPADGDFGLIDYSLNASFLNRLRASGSRPSRAPCDGSVAAEMPRVAEPDAAAQDLIGSLSRDILDSMRIGTLAELAGCSSRSSRCGRPSPT